MTTGSVDVDGRDGAEAARKVLLGRRGIDGPRFFPVADAQIWSRVARSTSCI